MKYLCLVYRDEQLWDALPRREYHALVDEIVDYREELRSGGHFVAADAVQNAHSATTVRVRDGKPIVTDGPYAETKEQIGGFYILEARDLNEAIRVAANIPSARLGIVEIRPIKELDQRSANGRHGVARSDKS